MGKNQKKPGYETLKVDYVAYKTLLTEKFRNRQVYIEKDPRKIIAVIPGTIRKIYVKPGQKIKEGDKLLILEAMKMKNVLYSDQDGVVKEVNIRQGMPVSKKQLLLELE